MLLKKLTFLTLLTFLLSCSNSEKAEKTVAIILAIDHPALNATKVGIIDQLIQEGFIQDENVKIRCESAQGNPSIASQIAQKYVGQHVDVLVTIGTMPSQAGLQAIQGTTIPVVYASVTDPKLAKLEGNITGVSNYVEPGIQFTAFKKILPSLKTIGVIYNPGEANSVSLNDQMKQAAERDGLILIFATASKISDVYSAALGIAPKVDALFVNNDNTALSALDAVLKAGMECKKPVFVSDNDMVEKGALAAIGPDQHKIGVRTGVMVANLLRNKGKASDIKPEVSPKPLFYINLKAAQIAGINVDETAIQEAAKVYS